MLRPRYALVLLSLLTGAPSPPKSECETVLQELEGWTILKVGTLRGSFEGCDFDRLLEFTDGTLVRCASYSYSYAFQPEAVLFGKAMTSQGHSASAYKLLVEDELYDIQSVRAHE